MSADSYATVSSIFPDMTRASRAVHDLEAAGLPRSRISMLTTEAASRSGAGTSLADSLASAGALRSGVALLAVGPRLVTLTGASVQDRAGGRLRALLGSSVAEGTVTTYERKLQEGGVVIAFSGAGGEVQTARQLLERAGASDLVKNLPQL